MRAPTWVELLLLMVHGPGDPGRPGPGDPTMRGVLRSHRSSGLRGNAMGWFRFGGEPAPVFTGAGHDHGEEPDEGPGALLRVWRDGAALRVEGTDGQPLVIADAEHVWHFDRAAAGEAVLPWLSPRSALVVAGSGTHLLQRRDGNEFAGDDFTRPASPVGATTFLGRAAWTVELLPPPGSPHPMQLVVDAATGLVLQQRVDGLGAVDEWAELVLGERLEPSLFRWDGPLRTGDATGDAVARHEAEREAERARWSSWFEGAVGPVRREVAAEAALDLTVRWVHAFDEDSGAFEATLGEGVQASLARRPRSEEPWELPWRGPHHRWSTARHDWAFHCHDVPLTARGLAAVERSFPDR
ncbi:hypothetical protein CLV92_11363 [Kineococcus xinjiangensis]|uniref:Uncharacterized protein n=1 Tax=Kineococcus xinjiangensis TaxID=512762 RepID=A0A2S6IEI6_9ACTN|nr:hypothetical protein [Kineococcus xinjiangensis]PPK92634.1 hypothetical protein CLV92_11363 [Kineococcus xinjiangensis]